MAATTTARRGRNSGTEEPPARSAKAPGSAPRRGRLLLLLAAAALLGGAAVWALYGSSWLRVEFVTAEGTRVLTPAQVEKAAAVPKGVPLASVDTDAVAARLLAELPRLRTAEVERSWPHGIELRVSERRPVLIIAKNGQYGEVDREGVRFATVGTRPKGVPLLKLDAARSPSLKRFPASRLRAEAVTAAADVPASVRGELRAVRVRSFDAISLELSGNRTVVWGSGEKGDTKAKALTALLKAAPKARHFDVSVPTAPAASDG
ncbi:FtsQ-type POTRA domain-containing protein [Streptomyces sp. L06]|nr:FtsQ-type POTRA domain-containing protein [Streptomyces sp. L06]